ncbi:hypothetical protein AB0C90_40365 [Streptomyces sp. NPDC048550]|uniref:hypothetical protein n=1 Tax=unclassified Streptomyces TaxID=2593676 RepID=UPI00342C7DAE
MPNEPAPLLPSATPGLLLLVLPAERDLRYDHDTGAASIPMDICFRDGSTVRSVLVADAARVELLYAQLDRGLELRKHDQKQQAAHERQ